MEEFKEILTDGEWCVKNNSDLYKVQELPQFKNCRLDYFDDISCDKVDLKSFILTEDMEFVGKGFIFRISQTPVMYDRLENNEFRAFTYLIITGIFDAIDTKLKVKRKFYED